MSDFIRVASVSEVPVGGSKCVTIRRKRVALFNLDGQIYAIDDVCSHAEAYLSEGRVDGDQVICPLHGARFRIKTGEALTLPAVTPVDTYEVKVEGDEVYVKL